MNLSLKEIEILNALQREYPKPSSVKKLELATKRDRSVIKNTLVGLKALLLLSVTDKSEVYLLKAGKEYLGIGNIDYADIKPFVSDYVTCKSECAVSPVVVSDEVVPKNTAKVITEPASDISTLDAAFVELEVQLKKRDIRIDELSLKIEVLNRLSELLSDDISEVLNSIAKDLTQADAA